MTEEPDGPAGHHCYEVCQRNKRIRELEAELIATLCEFAEDIQSQDRQYADSIWKRAHEIETRARPKNLCPCGYGEPHPLVNDDELRGNNQ